MTDLPRSTVTLLFTDLVHGSELWERNAALMSEPLQRYDALLQSIIGAHNGHRFNTTGHASRAVFASAADAVAAGVAIQASLQAKNWQQAAAGSMSPAFALEARIAIHTGAVEPGSNDAFGAPTNRAACLLAAAHPGQILVSLVAAELAREQLPPEVTLHDLGTHQLRDLTRPERIFQVVAPGLPAVFPPLQTLDRAQMSLPAQPTPLIGREWELANLCALLRRDEVRLVTLTGPGGTGKTRLALHAAAEIASQFVDGVCFVDLAPVAPHLVASTIARTFELRETAGQQITDQLGRYLHSRSLLLVLDNFEHVLDVAPSVAGLLAAAPRLKVLVTSRAALRLSGENEFAVPPLRLPARSQSLSVDRLGSYEAVRLFVQRAQAVRADFTLTAANAATVGEICQRLDGLPLAIELAAARTRLFTPAALLERLSQPLAVLTAGARDRPERQQTLRATIDWSYQQLTADEQALFRQLAVFVGGFTITAAETVCQLGTPTFSILDGIAALVDHNLLRSVDGASEAPRLSMLETLRDYALERLTLGGELEQVRRRHAEYYRALVEAAEPALRGAEQVRWLARLEEEHDNIRAALAWCRDHDVECGLYVTGACWPFWEIRGHVQEGRAWLTELLRTEVQVPDELRAKALHGAGVLAFQQSDYLQARALLEEGLTLCERRGDPAAIGYVLRSLGLLAWFQGDHGLAQAQLEHSVALYRGVDHTWGIADSLHYLGHVLLDIGDLERAVAVFEESLALFRTTGDTRNIALPLKDLGLIASQRGDYTVAAAQYQESLALSQKVSDINHVTDTLWRLGDLARLGGEYARAEELYIQCLDGYQKLDNRGGMAEALNLLGEVAQVRQAYAEARHFYEESLQIQREIGSKRMIAALLHNLGRVACHEGDRERARSLHIESLSLNAEIGYTAGIADCLVSMAVLALAHGRPARAVRLLSAAEPHLGAVRGFMPLTDRAQFDQALAAARAAMAAGAFEAEWAAGRSLGVGAAIAYARAAEEPAGGAAISATLTTSALAAQLTQREGEVLRLVAEGLTDAQVAERLVISPRTVHGHLRSIYGKLGVTSRTAATRLAIDHHLV